MQMLVKHILASVAIVSGFVLVFFSLGFNLLFLYLSPVCLADCLYVLTVAGAGAAAILLNERSRERRRKTDKVNN